jgi:hypothetical protein
VYCLVLHGQENNGKKHANVHSSFQSSQARIRGFPGKKLNARKRCDISFCQLWARKVALLRASQQQHLAWARISFHIKAKLVLVSGTSIIFPRLFVPSERKRGFAAQNLLLTLACRITRQRQKVDLATEI